MHDPHDTRVEDLTPSGIGSTTTQRRLIIGALVGSILIGAAVLLVAMFDEPYHLDEIRQTRAYTEGVHSIVDLAYEQEQPPLDALLNAGVQRLIGQGDARQRALSTLLGIASLALLGVLTFRNGFGWGSPMAVLLVATSAQLGSVLAYARPYALPLFLMLVLLVSIDEWLRTSRRWLIPIMAVTALLLPLSRAAEPLIALGAVTLVLGFRQYVLKARPHGSALVPMGIALGAAVLVGVPVVERMRSVFDRYPTVDPLSTRIGEMLSDIPQMFSVVVPGWPLVLLAMSVALLMPAARRLLFQQWWYWVLWAIPVLFAAAFFYQTPVSQGFSPRYTFTWFFPIAVTLGALFAVCVRTIRERDRASARSHVVGAALGVALVGTILLIGAVDLGRDLANHVGSDWRAAGGVVRLEAHPDGAVVFVEAGQSPHRLTAFPGVPRYVSRTFPLYSYVDLLGDPAVVDGATVALLTTKQPAIDGYQSNTSANGFGYYQSERPGRGPEAAALVLTDAASVLGVRDGVLPAVVGASIYAYLGEQDVACRIAVDFEVASWERTSDVLGESWDGGAWLIACVETS